MVTRRALCNENASKEGHFNEKKNISYFFSFYELLGHYPTFSGGV